MSADAEEEHRKAALAEAERIRLETLEAAEREEIQAWLAKRAKKV